MLWSIPRLIEVVREDFKSDLDQQRQSKSAAVLHVKLTVLSPFFSLDFVTTVMERPVLESLLEAIIDTVEWESHTMLTCQVRMNKENAVLKNFC